MINTEFAVFKIAARCQSQVDFLVCDNAAVIHLRCIVLGNRQGRANDGFLLSGGRKSSFPSCHFPHSAANRQVVSKESCSSACGSFFGSMASISSCCSIKSFSALATARHDSSVSVLRVRYAPARQAGHCPAGESPRGYHRPAKALYKYPCSFPAQSAAGQ